MFRTVFKHNLFFHIKKTKNKKQKTKNKKKLMAILFINLREQCS